MSHYSEAGPSRLSVDKENPGEISDDLGSEDERGGSRLGNSDGEENSGLGFVDGMDRSGFIQDTPLRPLTKEGLATFNAAQERAGVIYISRVPPGMQPAKVRHLMSAYGEVGRVYLQQEDAKRAYLRRKFTSTKKAHYTEGWIEFKDKKVARSVADMLNAQPIGGKKGTRWRDDIWTMKYLPKFKWYMLTEQVAHEAALHRAKLRVELSQSKAEQHQYLKNVELAKVLDKRATKKRENGEEFELKPNKRPRNATEGNQDKDRKKPDDPYLDSVLSSVF